MRLKPDIGGEFALALGGGVEPDGPVEILVTAVVRSLRSGVAGVGHGAGVELACAMRRADEGADDTLEMDLRRALAGAFSQNARRLGDEAFVRGADAVAIDDRRPKLSEMRLDWDPSGQARRTISSDVHLRGGRLRAGRRDAGAGLATLYGAHLAVIAFANMALWAVAILEQPSRPWRLAIGPGILSLIFIVAALAGPHAQRLTAGYGWRSFSRGWPMRG